MQMKKVVPAMKVRAPRIHLVFAAVLALALCSACAGSTTGMAAPATASASSDPVVGDWRVTFGNTTVVAISGSGGTYTVTATEPVQVTGSSCFLPPGTLIATFSGSGGSYSGQGGLWYTANCAFDEWTSLEVTLEGDTLTAKYGNGCASSPSCAKAVFTRVTPSAAPAPPPTPPVVTISSGPSRETAMTNAAFTFTGVAGGAYECSLDDGAWSACKSGQSFGPLVPGDHQFEVRETLDGITGPIAVYRWTVDLPRACVLKWARARVSAFTRQSKARLIIHYKAYKRARVSVSYALIGSGGSLRLGTASQRFKTAGIFKQGVTLSRGAEAKLRGTQSMTVRFSIPRAPSSCTRYYTKHLTIPRHPSPGLTVWFQSDSVFGPEAE
jgi:uncharacterized protein (DUF2147 family)